MEYKCIIPFLDQNTMNKVEENVLIPKEEYDILIEKVKHNQSTKIVNMDVTSKQRGLHEEEEEAESYEDEKVESAEASKEDSESQTGVFSESLKTQNPDIEQAIIPTNLETVKGDVTDDDDDDVDVMKPLYNDNAKINMLVKRVPNYYKDSVGLLAGYITEEGRDIIDWDKSLRFVHLKEAIPRTNIAKILMYVIDDKKQNHTKPPRGITMFTRSLKSIGITDIKSWLFSQNGNMLSPYGVSDVINETGKTEKMNSDLTDGGVDISEKNIKNKNNKNKQIVSEWISW